MNLFSQVQLSLSTRNGIIFVRTSNEDVCHRQIVDSMHKLANYQVITWDLILGMATTSCVASKTGVEKGLSKWDRAAAGNPAAPLDQFIESILEPKEVPHYCSACGFLASSLSEAEKHVKSSKACSVAEARVGQARTLYIVRGIDSYCSGEHADPAITRMLYTAAALITRSSTNSLLVITGLGTQLPPAVLQVSTVLDDPLPTREQIKVDLWPSVVNSTTTRRGDMGQLVPGKFAVVFEGVNPCDEDHAQKAADTLAGLSTPEIEAAIKRAILETFADDLPANQRWLTLIDKLTKAKMEGIKRSAALELMESLKASDIGGLAGLRQWLKRRAPALSAKAQKAGIPAPKGMCLVGIPGGGKSMIARSVGDMLNLPIVKFDVGAVFGQFVGQSETAMRNALRTVDTIAPCVLLMDEIDKGFAGVGGGSTDGGTTQRVFGSFLTWMQERSPKNPVFVIATANDISGLPPEMLRKGRFDELFFVDLPASSERAEILRIHLGKVQTAKGAVNEDKVVKACEGFSGAEIQQAVIEAQINSYADGVPLTEDYLLSAIAVTKPLSQTMAEKIQHLREWASSRARNASTDVAQGVQPETKGDIQKFLDAIVMED